MISFKNFINEASNKFIAFHNTDNRSYEDIVKNGFKMSSKVKRKKLFGNGIYFSEKSNARWGDNEIKVELSPRNPLLDSEGDIAYEGTHLGDKIEAIGKKMYTDFHMTNNEQRANAIDKFLKDNNYDMLMTDEHGKTIFIVRDPKIIKILYK